MQIQCMPILKVIFVLSTIVMVTDCCSSRILLLRQHTLQIEEHVVQLVNHLELQQQQQQQQLNFDGEPSARDIFADTAKMLQALPDLRLEGELASIATTEHDGSTQNWSLDEETTTSTRTTTTTTTTVTQTSTTATGEPPPDDSTPTTTPAPPQLATDATTLDLSAVTPTSSRNPKLTEDLSFQFPCSEEYLKYFCLNGGNCFRWAKNANSFSYCVCAVGYVGERCDSKTENGVYVPLRPPTAEPQLKTAHIVFSFPMLVLLSTIYVLFGAVFMLRNVSAQRRKQQQIHLHKQRFFVSC